MTKKINLSSNISSNVLFHFTNSFDKVKNILKEGFKISYFFESIPGFSKTFYIVPMVCFCDIPLSSIKTHLRRYGEYGLGIHKINSHQIHPVTYLCNNNMFNNIADLKENSILPYIKKYFGRDYKINSTFKFYNEREWRWVEKGKVEILTNSDEKKVRRLCQKNNKKYNKYLRLSPEKFEYIIVEKPWQVQEIINFIDKELKISEQKKKILYTKIISSVRIRYDF